MLVAPAKHIACLWCRSIVCETWLSWMSCGLYQCLLISSPHNALAWAHTSCQSCVYTRAIWHDAVGNELFLDIEEVRSETFLSLFLRSMYDKNGKGGKTCKAWSSYSFIFLPKGKAYCRKHQFVSEANALQLHVCSWYLTFAEFVWWNIHKTAL